MLGGKQERAPMPTYPIFMADDSDRTAINPDFVVSVAEVQSGRVSIYLLDPGVVTVKMTLEGVIARLAGRDFDNPLEEQLRRTPQERSF
jgi:hypothetical protein